MTLDPLYSPSVHTKQTAFGWLTSGLLHVILVISAMLFVQRIQLASQSEPFTWDVAMESAAPSLAPANEARVPQEPASSASATAPPSMPPDSPRMTDTVVTRTEVAKISPPPMSPPVPQPLLKSSQAPLANPQPKPPADTSMQPPSPSQPATEEMGASAPFEHATSSTVQPAPLARQETALTPNEPQGITPPQDEPQMAAPTSSIQSKPTKVDNAWLSAAMARWIEALDKRYPAALRTDGVHGRVTLLAVLHEDGTLSDVRVAKSSGNALLDEVAIEDVRNGPAVRLSRPLERPHMPVKFSIVYDLKMAP